MGVCGCRSILEYRALSLAFEELLYRSTIYLLNVTVAAIMIKKEIESPLFPSTPTTYSTVQYIRLDMNAYTTYYPPISFLSLTQLHSNTYLFITTVDETGTGRLDVHAHTHSLSFSRNRSNPVLGCVR